MGNWDCTVWGWWVAMATEVWGMLQERGKAQQERLICAFLGAVLFPNQTVLRITYRYYLTSISVLLFFFGWLRDIIFKYCISIFRCSAFVKFFSKFRLLFFSWYTYPLLASQQMSSWSLVIRWILLSQVSSSTISFSWQWALSDGVSFMHYVIRFICNSLVTCPEVVPSLLQRIG